MLVDDDPFFSSMVKRWLLRLPGIKCASSCLDAETALRELSSVKPSLMLVDFGLPGMKGGDLISNAKKRLPFLKTVLVSGIPEESIAFDALDVGVDRFINESDINESSLAPIIVEVMAGGCPLSARVRWQMAVDYFFNRLLGKPALNLMIND